MEKINNGCVLLKQKEYDELVEKSKRNESKEIKLSWSYDHYCGSCGWPYLNVYGSVILSDKIKSQLNSILQNITDKFNENISEIRKEQEDDDNLKFSKLSLWRRIFFKY